jgi:hypothetical protein
MVAISLHPLSGLLLEPSYYLSWLVVIELRPTFFLISLLFWRHGSCWVVLRSSGGYEYLRHLLGDERHVCI